MDIVQNRLFSGSESGGRFSEYEIYTEQYEEKNLEDLNVELKKAVEEKDLYYRVPWRHGYEPRLFIVPTKDAVYQASPVDVFNYYPNILLDFMDMGRKLYDESPDYPQLILNFCNKYGLFNVSGLYANAFGEAEEVDFDGDNYYAYKYEWVLLSEAGMYGFKIPDSIAKPQILTHDFIDQLIPRTWWGFREFLEDKENLHVKLFNNYYCESIEHLHFEIWNLYSRISRWYENIDEEGDPTTHKQKLSKYLTTYPIAVSIDHDRRWKLKWVYKSLIDALNIMFLNNIVETNEQIKICVNCNTAFIASREFQRYCSERCSNANRQREYYRKHKKKNQKD